MIYPENYCLSAVQTALLLNRIVRRAEYLMPILNDYKFYCVYI